jgi:hypothetical protein
MKAQIWFGAVLLVLASAAAARSQELPAGGQGVGPGMNSCAQFARAYLSSPATAEDAYFLWAADLMSGLNALFQERTGRYRDFSHADIAKEKLRIRSYCDAHPLAQYVSAVFALYETLPIIGH